MQLIKWFRVQKTFLIEGVKVINHFLPPANWQTSTRKSPSLWNVKADFEYLYLTSVTELLPTLTSLAGAGIIFDDKQINSPYPHGVIWVNYQLKDRLWYDALPHRAVTATYRGYIGYEYQDGCKFHNAIARAALEKPYTIIVKKNWLWLHKEALVNEGLYVAPNLSDEIRR